MSKDTTDVGRSNNTLDFTGQKLIYAEELYSNDKFKFIEAVVLVTERRQFLIEVDADVEKLRWKMFDSDSIITYENKRPRRQVLKPCVDCPISLLWTLEDPAGALDAIQLMFSPKNGSELLIIQFMAVDSQVTTFRLIPNTPDQF